MKTSRLIVSMLLIAFMLSTVSSCARSKCAALDSGDVKVSKNKKKKPTKGLFSKKELRRKRW